MGNFNIDEKITCIKDNQIKKSQEELIKSYKNYLLGFLELPFDYMIESDLMNFQEYIDYLKTVK